MNQRIQELADQAEDYADGIVDQGGEFHQAYTQKLAELIVEECAALFPLQHTDEQYSRRISKTIKKHFGMYL